MASDGLPALLSLARQIRNAGCRYGAKVASTDIVARCHHLAVPHCRLAGACACRRRCATDAMPTGSAEALPAVVGDGYEQTDDGEPDDAVPLDPCGAYLLLDCPALSSGAGGAKRPSLSSVNPGAGPLSAASAPLPGAAAASARLGGFVAQLQALCKAAMDARSGGSATRSGVKSAKTPSRREAASAASVVEELEGIEAKARAGKYDGRVEDVIAEVTRCIEIQSSSFADVLPAVEEKAEELRAAVEEAERRAKVFGALRAASVGIGRAAGSGEEGEAEGPGAASSPRASSGDAAAGCKGDVADSRLPAIHMQATRRFGELAAEAAAADTLDGVEEAWSRHGDANDDDDDDALEFLAPTLCEFVALSASSALPRREVGRSVTAPAPAEEAVAALSRQDPIMSTFEAIGRIRDLRKQIFAFFDQVTSGRKPDDAAPPPLVPEGQAEEDQASGTDAVAVLASSATGISALPLEAKETADASVAELVIRNEPSRGSCEMEISTEVGSNELRSGPEVWAKARAATALLLGHGGFAEASDTAINVLTELMGDYIERIGRHLSSSRSRRGMGAEDVVKRKPRRMAEQAAGLGAAENPGRINQSADADDVDPELGFVAPQPVSPTRDERFELIKLICSTGFRGGFPELQQYISTDIPRLTLEVREAEEKVRNKMTEFAALHSSHLPATTNVEPSDKQDPPSSERGADARLSGDVVEAPPTEDLAKSSLPVGEVDAQPSEDVTKAQASENRVNVQTPEVALKTQSPDVVMAAGRQDDPALKSSPARGIDSLAPVEKEGTATASDREIEAGAAASKLLPLSDAARMFGILTPSVRLDVLLGVEVPRKLVGIAAPPPHSTSGNATSSLDADGDVSMAV